MNKLNNLGQNLLQRKEDLILYQNQDRIVEALLFQVDEQFIKTGIIDNTTSELLKNDKFDTPSFRNYLLGNVQFLKSDAELYEDFKRLNDLLTTELAKQDMDYVTTDIDLKGDKLKVMRTYIIDSEYVTDHFDVDKNKVNDLMKINGFVSKYAVLRLPKILNDFIRNTEDDIPHFFSLEASKVFENNDPIGYNIDLIFNIKTDELENKNNIEHIVLYIKDIIQDCDEYFDERTRL